MSRPKVTRGILLGVLAAGGLAALPAAAATKAEQSRAAAAIVEATLQREAQEGLADRAELLRPALDLVPGYPAAMWHSGVVRWGQKWLRFDEVAQYAARDLRLVQYQQRREKTPDTLEGHLALAGWCAKKKLEDQQRAHLTRVLSFDPDYAPARAALGFVRIDGAWIAPAEIEQAQVRAGLSVAAMTRWKPELEKIREQLLQPHPQLREKARQRLMAIDDPAAVLALEAVFSGQGEEAALLVVEVLGRMRSDEAAIGLARQAVLSPEEAVRRAAAQKLRARSPESYVPPLLSALSTPIRSRAELYQAPSGRLTYRHLFYREGQEKGHLAMLETEYRRTVLSAGGDLAARKAALEEARLRDAALKAQMREMAVATENAVIEHLNQRICWALSEATTQRNPATPEAWWQWWNDYNGLVMVGDKPVEQAYRRESVAFAELGPQLGVAGAPADGGVATTVQLPTFSCCLASGTPVWTSLGPVPIEKLRVGDCVVSQDPESGKLALKPILDTVSRTPARLVRFQAGNETVRCSGGHPFWVSGQGWVRARHLAADAILHTMTATARASKTEESDVGQVHNLVVADFHTYFVGRQKLLSHDNTVPKPSSTRVPGLAKR